MSVLNGEALPTPEKSIVQQQQDLVDEILEILDMPADGSEAIDACDYAKIRAAIAHYTVTILEEKSA